VIVVEPVVVVVVDEVDVDVVIVEVGGNESTEMFLSHVSRKSRVASQPAG
jgi:hypothetical protein